MIRSQTFRIVAWRFGRKFCFAIFDWLRVTFDRLNALFWSIDQESNLIESCRNSRIISFNIWINRTEVSIDRNSWNLNFHKENSRIRIFTLFILQMNTLQPYIIITIYPCIYLYTTPTQYEIGSLRSNLTWTYILKLWVQKLL